MFVSFLISRTVTRHICACSWRQVREQDGTEIFEFALVAPLVLMLLFGIFWISRAFNVYETITRAAREGARYAVLPSSVASNNALKESYTTAGTSSSPACLSNPTYEFTNYVSPALSASSLDPGGVQNFCQQAVVLDPNTDASVQQCGVQISFQYPVKLLIPFTTLDFTTINISTSVQMRMENQSRNNTTGELDCPGTN